MTVTDLRSYAEAKREDWEFEHPGQTYPADTERWLQDARTTKADAEELLFELGVQARINWLA